MGRLQHYAWPGNVRQLENLIRGLTVVSSGPVIGIDQLPQEIITGTEVSQAVGGSDFFARKETCVRAFEQDYLRRLLRNHQGNVAAAAQTAGLPRWTLYRLLKRHALRPEDFRPGGPDQDSTPAAAAGFGRLPTTRVGGADA
jgi:DNA-binding NtrC family response regulator